MADFEESVSGFKVRGDWVDAVEHGERIVSALRDIADDEDVDSITAIDAVLVCQA